MTNQDRMPNAAAIEEILVERMRDDLTRPKWWNTLKGRLAIVGASALIVSTGVAGVALVQPKPIDDTTMVQCLERASRNLDGTLSGAYTSVASPKGVLQIEDAVAMCQQMWAAGAFESDNPLDPSPTPGTVPDAFTLCVTDENTAAVVPGRIECSALGLSPYTD